MRVGSFGPRATSRSIAPSPGDEDGYDDDDDECGTIDGMRMGRGNRSIRRKAVSEIGRAHV
jgi:hypothetical protein